MPIGESEHDEYSVNVELGGIVVTAELTVCVGFIWAML
jgi:hypothetical protein